MSEQMSEQWLGLHNHDRHERNGLAAWCSNEEITCAEHYPCRCCLAAEVEALLTWATEEGYAPYLSMRKRALAAEVQVQRVREVIDEGRKDRGWGHDDDFDDYDAGWDRCANDVERALDGGV